MKNKILAGLTALLLAGGGVAISAAPASAHTGDLNVSYSCDTKTGEYVGTADLTISQTGLSGVSNWRVGSTSFEGTPSSDAGLSGAVASNGAGKITLGSFRIPGNTKTKGPWVYAFTTWSDGFKKGSDGQSYQNLSGDCTIPYVPPVDAKFDVGITPATCTVGETLSYGEGNITNASFNSGATPSGTTGPNAFSVGATANEGAAFVEGTVNPISGNLAGPIGNQSTDSAAPCYVPPIPPVLNVCPGDLSGDLSTNLNDLWTNIDTRLTGHQEYVPGGLRIWTEGATSTDKVSEGRAVSFPLKNTGVVSVDYTATLGNVKPGVNLFVTFAPGVKGTLVFEPTYADGSPLYGQDAWLTNGSSQVAKDNAPVNGGGNGSQWHGTVDQWLSVYPDAQVTGIAYSAGSGVHLDGVIHSINLGCTTFYFDYAEAPPVIPKQPKETVTAVDTTDKNCDTKIVTTTTTTTTSGRTVYNEETNTWDSIENLVVVTSSERPTTAEECPIVVENTPTPSETTVPTIVDGDLATTGSEMNPAPFLWVVFGTIGLGLMFLVGTAIWRRRTN